jgi:hypothetical protein
MMATVAVTALVFALAHAWSTALARSAEDRQALSPGHVLDGIRHEWPMVEAVAPTLVALALAALDAYSVNTGLWVAIIANTVLLFVWARFSVTAPPAARSSSSPPGRPPRCSALRSWRSRCSCTDYVWPTGATAGTLRSPAARARAGSRRVNQNESTANRATAPIERLSALSCASP